LPPPPPASSSSRCAIDDEKAERDSWKPARCAGHAARTRRAMAVGDASGTRQRERWSAAAVAPIEMRAFGPGSARVLATESQRPRAPLSTSTLSATVPLRSPPCLCAHALITRPLPCPSFVRPREAIRARYRARRA
jgi:hypothetical protein